MHTWVSVDIRFTLRQRADTGICFSLSIVWVEVSIPHRARWLGWTTMPLWFTIPWEMTCTLWSCWSVWWKPHPTAWDCLSPGVTMPARTTMCLPTSFRTSKLRLYYSQLDVHKSLLDATSLKGGSFSLFCSVYLNSILIYIYYKFNYVLGNHAVLYIYKHVDQMMYIHVCMKGFGLRGETSNRKR